MKAIQLNKRTVLLTAVVAAIVGGTLSYASLPPTYGSTAEHLRLIQADRGISSPDPEVIRYLVLEPTALPEAEDNSKCRGVNVKCGPALR